MMIIFKFNIVIIKMIKLIMLNFLVFVFIFLIGFVLVLGVCLIKYIVNNVNRIEIINIEC